VGISASASTMAPCRVQDKSAIGSKGVVAAMWCLVQHEGVPLCHVPTYQGPMKVEASAQG